MVIQLKNNYVLKVESQFQKDFQRFKKEHPELLTEFKVAMRELVLNGAVPDSYHPHVLDNRGGLHNGSLDFHLSDGKVDVVVLYLPHKTNPVIRLIRIGTHDELFR